MLLEWGIALTFCLCCPYVWRCVVRLVCRGDCVLCDQDDGLVDPPVLMEHDPTVREEGKAQDLLLLAPSVPGSTVLSSGR